MDKTDEIVSEKFIVICKNCGRIAKIEFYEGCIAYSGGDTGHMKISCTCGSSIKLR